MGPRTPRARMVAAQRSRPLVGVSYWRRKANRLLRTKHWKYSAELIGDLFTDLLGGTAVDEKSRRIWSRNFLRVCSNTEIWIQFGAKRDVCVPIFLCRLNIS